MLFIVNIFLKLSNKSQIASKQDIEDYSRTLIVFKLYLEQRLYFGTLRKQLQRNE